MTFKTRGIQDPDSKNMIQVAILRSWKRERERERRQNLIKRIKKNRINGAEVTKGKDK
jgi:hypothetical protein